MTSVAGKLRGELLRFAGAGVVGLCVDVALMYLLIGAGVGLLRARPLAFLGAVVATWQLNRRYTFGRAGAGGLWREWWTYFGAMLGGGAVNLAVSGAVLHWGPHAWPLLPLVAVAAGSLGGMAVNFAGAKWLVYHPDGVQPHTLAARAGVRGWALLDGAAAPRWCACVLPLLAGLVALRLGQDVNWDLQNYHLYNPHALLHGRIGQDLAPAQWQSYFNPTIDLLYYGLARTLPAPLAGFLMGALHGLNFVLALAIARRVLGAAARRVAVLLALAGCLAPGFLSELGNTMGDNLSALFVLGALLVLLRHWDALAAPRWRAAAVALAAGAAMGIGSGLKLTNAVYALALCAALLSLGGSPWQRLRRAGAFGVGVLAGIGVAAGHWYWRMWTVFGNPLFPQFNDIFRGPLAAPIGIGDTGWIPRGIGEKLLWPFIFTRHPERVIELPLHQLIWPLLYLAFLALGVAALAGALRRPANSVAAASTPQARLLLCFFALAYLVWLNLFGIYRYLVPLELLAPLALWLIAQRLLPARVAPRAAGALLLVAALAAYPFVSWGHVGWAQAAFRADVPAFAQPAQSMVLTVHGDPPMGWVVTFFPDQLAVVALGSGFPESPAFRARVDAMLAARSGPLYVMLQADRGAAASPAASAAVRAAAAVAAEARQRGVLAQAAEVLGRYRIVFDGSGCTTYAAFIGSARWNYQLCGVAIARPPT